MKSVRLALPSSPSPSSTSRATTPAPPPSTVPTRRSRTRPTSRSSRTNVPRRIRAAFGRNTIGAVWGDLVAIGDQAAYEIKAFAADGALVMIVRRDGDPGSPTRAEQDDYWERRYADRPPDSRAESLRAVKDMPLVDSYRAFSRILSDRLGYLWVRERGRAVWTVFDPEGRLRGLVETPSGLGVVEIGEDYILGRARDDLGVEYVQLWGLDRDATSLRDGEPVQ